VQQDDLGDGTSLHCDLHIHAGRLGYRAQLSQEVHPFSGTVVERDFRRGRMKDQELCIVASRQRQGMRKDMFVPIVNRDRTDHT
jgi:hypothetical protein